MILYSCSLTCCLLLLLWHSPCIHLTSELVDKLVKILLVISTTHAWTTKVLISRHLSTWLTWLVKEGMRRDFKLILHLGHHRFNHFTKRSIKEHLRKVNDIIWNTLAE